MSDEITTPEVETAPVETPVETQDTVVEISEEAPNLSVERGDTEPEGSTSTVETTPAE